MWSIQTRETKAKALLLASLEDKKLHLWMNEVFNEEINKRFNILLRSNHFPVENLLMVDTSEFDSSTLQLIKNLIENLKKSGKSTGNQA